MPAFGLSWFFLFGLFAFIPFIFVAHIASQSQGRKSAAGYPVQPGVYGGQPPGGLPLAGPKSRPPDPDFRDDFLDGLIDDGRLSEARKYLREMIEMARSMHDETGLRNYAQYEPRINKAAMDSTRRRRDY